MTSLSEPRISRSVSWNLIGAIIPLVVAVITIPILIESLGTERFGVLTIIWMVVGYFSLFDLGLGRALTKLVASNIGKGKSNENPKLIWTALLLMGLFGIVGTLVLIGFSPIIVTDLLNIPKELQSESLITFYLLSISVPFVISSSGLIGILEAYHRFKIINIVRIPLGIMTFLGPVLVLPFSNSLVFIIVVLITVRLIAWLAYIYLVFRVVPKLRKTRSLSKKMTKSLFSFGSWMTITNIIGPLMVYLDRFMIGSILSMAAVAYYATPFEMVTKLWIISGALMSVLFPAFSATLEQDHSRAIQLSNKAVKYLFMVFFPITLIIISFSYEILEFWIDTDFARNSYLVLQLLALGIFINAHAQVPYAIIQASGRPDITAKLHLIELPIYLLLLAWMLSNYGIVGAALSWSARIFFDSTILFMLVSKISCIQSFFTTSIMLKVSFVFCVIAVAFITTDIYLKLAFILLTLTLFCFLSWHYLLTESDKNIICRKEKFTI